jgi:putative oxidoreductase
MKTMYLISRLLLGLIFTVFGLNGFLHFIPMPPPTGLAAQFLGALFVSHYLVAVFAIQLAGGVLLLVNRYVPFALTILGPIVANVVLFHSLMAPSGLPLATVTTVLWVLTFVSVRTAFVGIFAARTGTQTASVHLRANLAKAV